MLRRWGTLMHRKRDNMCGTSISIFKFSRVLAVLITLLVPGGCREKPEPHRDLSGSWSIDIEGTGNARATGSLMLRRTTARPCESAEVSPSCDVQWIGTNSVDTRDLLGHSIDSVSGAAYDPGAKSVALVMGRCCDIGALGMRLRWRNDSTLSGSWEEERANGGRSGAVTLVRRGPP